MSRRLTKDPKCEAVDLWMVIKRLDGIEESLKTLKRNYDIETNLRIRISRLKMYNTILRQQLKEAVAFQKGL